MSEPQGIGIAYDNLRLERELDGGSLMLFGHNKDRLAQVQWNITNTVQGRQFVETCRERPGDRDFYIDWHCEYTANMALYALLTGSPDAGRIAVRLVMHSVRKGMAAINVQGTHGLEVRDVLPRVALAVNWCRPWFSEREFRECLSQLQQWAEWVWPETNPARKDHWAVNKPGDNFYHGYMLGIIYAGLALQPHLPTTADRLLSIAEERWVRQVVPFLEKEQAGAFPTEGAVYGVETMMRIWQYGDAAFQANRPVSGRSANWINTAWHHSCHRFLRHYTAPDGKHHVPFGDAGGDHRDRLTPYPLAVALIAANHQPPDVAEALHQWRKFIAPPTWAWLLWHHVIWNNSGMAGRFPNTPPEATNYIAPGAGFATARTAWDSKADMLAVVAGPGGQNHSDLGQGGFAMWCGEAGEWVTGPSRIWAASTLRRETPYHNVPVVPPYNQPEFDTRLEARQNEGKIKRFHVDESHVAVDMQLESAYYFWRWDDDRDMSKNIHPALLTFRRRLCWVPREKTLVLLDEMVPALEDQVIIEQTWLKPTLGRIENARRVPFSLAGGVPAVVHTIVPATARLSLDGGELSTRLSVPDVPEIKGYRMIQVFVWGAGADTRPEPVVEYPSAYVRVKLPTADVFFGTGKTQDDTSGRVRIVLPWRIDGDSPLKGVQHDPASPFSPAVSLRQCPGCTAVIGDQHEYDCPFQVCSECGRRWVVCNCERHDPQRSQWFGQLQVVNG